MYDQSFNSRSLERVFQRQDFHGFSTLEQEVLREKTLAQALFCIAAGFKLTPNPLKSFPLLGKTVFMFSDLGNELVARKLCENLKKSCRSVSSGRSQIVSNLQLLLAEGIPFRVYRLDIKSFYESFDIPHVLSNIDELQNLSPQSKSLICGLLECHAAIGGEGIPRGLSISASLSEFLMQSFDRSVRSHSEVFFYSRYVDDIIIITSLREDLSGFVKRVEKLLPTGLSLNQSKKQVESAVDRVKPTKLSDSIVRVLKFDYLGYTFSIYQPIKINNKKEGDYFRSVIVDIAEKKILRFKTRISRSFLEFGKTGDWHLLHDRIKFLTKNFSVFNLKAGGKKLAGIFHSYPLISTEAKGLQQLDDFLKNAVLSKNGRLSAIASIKLTSQQKRLLLAQSFVKGHAERSFVHFSGMRLKQIQQCWKN